MTLKIMNPATGEVVQSLQEDTPEHIQEKFQKAKKIQVSWARTPLSQRLEIIQNFRKIVVERKNELAKTLTLEVGKAISQSLNELNGLLPRIDFFLGHTPKALQDEVVSQDATEEKISHEPLGVIANISAWNYPYFVGSNVFIPALLTGNTVLYKPSEFASLTGLAIQDALHSAGVPKDVFQAIIGSGATGAEVLRLPVNGIFFTGSYATGQKIAELSSRKMIKSQLELGGKDPVYLCEDVDIATSAAAVADGAFYNTGQSCCSVERIYVHQTIYEAFVKAFVDQVQSFVVGDPLEEKTYIGPLTRKVHLEFLEKQVADAQKKGAKLLCGGKRMTTRPGFYFEPTVFSHVDHSMELMREETFGPMIGIQSVKDDAEAIHRMNDTDYGLTAGVYTPNRARAVEILSQINSGTVYWNCCDRVSPRLPWSGRKHSGIGSTLSTYGIQTFLQPKAWHLRK